MSKSLLLFIFSLALCGVGHAQSLRTLPQQGERGTLGDTQPLPQVQIGSRLLHLAPGAVIYDQQNRSIVPAQLPIDADIFYTKDANGDVQRIYILTEQEKAGLDRARRR
jgi:hypothetical protein